MVKELDMPKVKINVSPLPKHYTMQLYRGEEGKTPFILDMLYMGEEGKTPFILDLGAGYG